MNYVYLLRCADGSLYCGWTTDLDARVKAHNSGRGAKYTRSRLPAELVWWETYADRHEALSREWHIKRMTRARKEALAKEGTGMDPKKEKEYADEIPEDEEEREDDAYEPVYRDGSVRNECWAGNEYTGRPE
jgi:putative endonuclease